MKKNDIAIIILIVSVCIVAGYGLGRLLIPSDRNKSVTYEYVEPISSDAAAPDVRIFNGDSVNPSVQIIIGAPSNQKPFNGN
ncbi:MAG: hypothetical protein WBB33_00470 [Candidatus Saccharimonadales bacterium]